MCLLTHKYHSTIITSNINCNSLIQILSIQISSSHGSVGRWSQDPYKFQALKQIGCLFQSVGSYWYFSSNLLLQKLIFLSHRISQILDFADGILMGSLNLFSDPGFSIRIFLIQRLDKVEAQNFARIYHMQYWILLPGGT